MGGGDEEAEREDTNIDLALDNPNLLNTTQNGDTVNGYQRTIELSPHGYAHCAVMSCRATVMGAVPFSSNDPIFWVHHANIDRLWDCWLSISGHSNPSSIMNQPFSFVDTNGNLVTKLVKNLFDGSLIDYVYQQPSNCARKQPAPEAVVAARSARTVAQARAALRRPVLIGEAKGLAIDAAVAKKRVTLPATASLSHPRQFALEEQVQLPVATELVLRGVHFESHPATSFRVYLERAGNPAKRAFVGTMSFFSDEPTGSDTHRAQGQNVRVFDATDALRELDLKGTGAFDVDVVFEAVDEPVGPAFDPAKAKLAVDEIEFFVKRDL